MNISNESWCKSFLEGTFFTQLKPHPQSSSFPLLKDGDWGKMEHFKLILMNSFREVLLLLQDGTSGSRDIELNEGRLAVMVSMSSPRVKNKCVMSGVKVIEMISFLA